LAKGSLNSARQIQAYSCARIDNNQPCYLRKKWTLRIVPLAAVRILLDKKHGVHYRNDKLAIALKRLNQMSVNG